MKNFSVSHLPHPPYHKSIVFFLVIFYLHLNNSEFFFNLKTYCDTFCAGPSMSLSCFILLMMNTNLITEIPDKMKHFLCLLRLTSELLIKYNKVLFYFCNTEWQDCLFSAVMFPSFYPQRLIVLLLLSPIIYFFPHI